MASILDTLSGLSVPAKITAGTKALYYRPLQAPWPEWAEQLIRLTKRVMVDIVQVNATYADVDQRLTWAQVGALCSTYGAKVTIFSNFYQWGGYTNTSATVTNGGGGTSDADHITDIEEYLDHIAAAASTYSFTVDTCFGDIERFSAVQNSNPDTGGRQAHNTALVLKFQNVEDAFKAAFPSGSFACYGIGGVRPEATENARTHVATYDFQSPYPWGGGWGLEVWNINKFDVGDLSEAYTTGLVTPYYGDFLCPALYYPNEPWTIQDCVHYSNLFNPAEAMVPFLAMGCHRVRTFDAWTSGILTASDYSYEHSKMYGAMFNINAYYSTAARAQRWFGPVTTGLSGLFLWPAPNDIVGSRGYMRHFKALIDGMNS